MISISFPTDRNSTWSTVRWIYWVTARMNGAMMPVEPIPLIRHSDGRSLEKDEEDLNTKAKTVYTWNLVLCHLKKKRVLRLGGLLSLYKVLPSLKFVSFSVLFLSVLIYRLCIGLIVLDLPLKIFIFFCYFHVSKSMSLYSILSLTQQTFFNQQSVNPYIIVPQIYLEELLHQTFTSKY
jgi:hypothetical protein